MTAMDPIVELITSFNELNSSAVEELHEQPSPLEFMRFVAANTPFVVRQGARDWSATKIWSAEYLLQSLQGHSVNIAVTPFGLVSPCGSQTMTYHVTEPVLETPMHLPLMTKEISSLPNLTRRTSPSRPFWTTWSSKAPARPRQTRKSGTHKRKTTTCGTSTSRSSPRSRSPSPSPG